MNLFHSTMVFIILYTIVITTTAVPITEEEVIDSYGMYGEKVEGDMLLSKEQKAALYNTGVNTRNGLVDTTYRWPNGIVVYHIVEKLFDNRQLNMIKNAMAEIESKSCVKFRPRNNKEYATFITNKFLGCFSTVGYNVSADRQVINLGRGCDTHGIMMHEMLHSLGFYHMQSTYNRDEFVTIKWENIKDRYKHNFIKYSRDAVTDFGVPYDYNSLLHYPPNAFSRNRKDTIVPKQNGVKIGPGNGLTASDILKLNKMYNC